MINTYHHYLEFGQYKGLSVKQIFQGTLNINNDLLTNYLTKILNEQKTDFLKFKEMEFIERFEFVKGAFHVIGEIHNSEKRLTQDNRVRFGNIQTKLANFINLHFNDNYLGILQDLRSFNKMQSEILPIGADPEYLVWCEHNIDEFKISNECKTQLEKLPISRFIGIQIMFVGEETYEYYPQCIIEYFKFNNTNL
tara:strand:+ start:1753 stop:2337 length:585 start_codon:yes stop_codon:yes gene_type:complete